MTKKEYRQHLNDTIGFDTIGKGVKGRYKARKRKYGDYLWFQDREMFNASYLEFLIDNNYLKSNLIKEKDYVIM